MVATYGGRRPRLALVGLGVAVAAALAGCSSGGGAAPAGSSGRSGPGASATAGPSRSAPAGPVQGSPGTAGPGPGGSAPADGSQRSVLNNLPGDPKGGTCVAVGGRTDVRSGTMAAGNFVTARKAFADQVRIKEQPSVPLYLIPSNVKGLKTVTVKLRSTSGGTGRTVSSDRQDYADDWLYFPVDLNIPSRGTWEITATAGTNTGCFSVTFG
jgi:hypothetical protein